MTALVMAAPTVCWVLLLTLATVTITAAGQVQPANEDGIIVVSPGISTRDSVMQPRHGSGSRRGTTPPITMRVSMSGLFNSLPNEDEEKDRTVDSKENVTEEEIPMNATIEWPEDMDMNKLDMNSMLMLSNISTMEDYAAMFMSLELPLPSDNATEGFSNTTKKGSVVDAVSATCQPKEEIVFLHLPEEPVHPHLPAVTYFPRCMRLMRCGGCCTGDLITCQPTNFTDIALKVMRVEKSTSPVRVDTIWNELFKTVRSRRRRERFRPHASELKMSSSYSIVHEVQHTACKCQCKVKEKDCIPDLQDYDHTNCRCTCNNVDEKKSCVTTTHYWDKDVCKCYCKTTEKCSTGQIFNHPTCSCINSS